MNNVPEAVIVVSDYYPTMGGTERQASNQARGMIALGIPSIVLTRRHDRSWARQVELEGLDVRRFGLPGSGRFSEKASLLSLWWWLVKRHRHLTMVQTIMYPDFAFMAALAGLRRRTIAVWAAHGEATDVIGPAQDRLRRMQRWLRRQVLNGCHHVALTPAIAEELRALGLRRPNVIPVAVDGKKFCVPSPDERAAARMRLGLTSEEIVFVYTGRFHADKGLARLVEAFAAVAQTGSHARLLLVGNGELESVQAVIRKAGVDSRTLLPGAVDDVETYLRASDVFVLPSLREGLSNSLAEAMSCGLACVAAVEAGGDQVLYGGAGMVPPSASTADLTHALLRLAQQPRLRRQLGDAAASRSSMFADDRVAESYCNLLTPSEPRLLRP